IVRLLGVGIPVFARAQKAKINSAKFSKQIAANQSAISLQKLSINYQQTLALYKQHNETVNYFENTGLKNASLIIETANKQFSSGLINYLEWFMLVNQAIAVNNDYLDAVRHLNESIIQLNYYNNQ
ncbi:MAG TPA: TolC family protein, partial [Lacibacter sp.]|nr:TolC family protein [Lacibacter sp.]